MLDSKRNAYFYYTLIKSNDKFYFLLSKPICLCLAISFATFSCHTAIRRKNILMFVMFVKNGQTHKILAHCVKKSNFQCDFAAREFSMM